VELIIAHVGYARKDDRGLRVIVDDKERASVTRGESISIELPKGPHSVRIENRTDVSDTLLVRASGDHLQLNGGLVWSAHSGWSTVWNRLVAGPELRLSPVNVQEMRVSLLRKTAHSRATSDYMKRHFVGISFSETRALVWLLPAAVLVAASWVFVRGLLS
jgi:hypothetical protein